VNRDALDALVIYRLGQATEAIEEARLMNEARHFRAAVNRAYYAMFYAVQALLAEGGFNTSKHSGAIALFNREFVKTGVFDKRLSKWLTEIFDLRQDADYGDMSEVSGEQAMAALKQAEEFVASVAAHFQG